MGLVTSEGISHASHQMLKAAENGDTETVINYITKTGVPLTVKNNYGVSAIIFAANNGHRDLVKALVEVGANIEDRSNNWKTPLNWAAHWGHYDCVEYLVGAGANISTFDSKGMTPLMSATYNGNARIVQFLLDKGANPLTKNVYNGTALTIARVKNNTMLISILEPYFPPETESSPYIIMYDHIVTGFEKVISVILNEGTRFYADMQPHLELLQGEVNKAWGRISAQRTASAEVEHEQTSPSSSTSETQSEVNEPVVAQCSGDTCIVEEESSISNQQDEL
eukprot:CAMPEP_0170373308 /NCGR_PEP_ID=MMETSP0117_2-20130122/10003_1 /TAXON_ID=400756 /ORGANISM="Durinskia baltica, Strain CSIRO CS-38" /LENGTH=280 /DNA_ID=CAMNT_0010628197 /DNA_START=100 /DNA_END=942 /DNA_ORIENTATION=+